MPIFIKCLEKRQQDYQFLNFQSSFLRMDMSRARLNEFDSLRPAGWVRRSAQVSKNSCCFLWRLRSFPFLALAEDGPGESARSWTQNSSRPGSFRCSLLF